MHIGGLRTAMYAYFYAKKNGGTFILRIEDTDTERKIEGANEIIYRTLKDSGLIYDEGPDVGGDYGPYIQSERKATYMQYAEQLVKNGYAYYCFCSKDRLEKLHEQGHTKYDKACLKLEDGEVKKRIASGEPYVIRLNVPLSGLTSYTDMIFGEIKIDAKDLEDNILIKSDGMPTYNFANVIDDHLMNINCVIRGVEYLSSTPKYNLVYEGLGWDKPMYIHLQPVMKDATRKISKRMGDSSYEDYIEKGYLGEAIMNYVALLGWSPKDNREKLSLAEMQELFSLDGISKSPSIFDEDKMRWLNSLYIKELSPEDFHRRALPFYEKVKYLKGYNLELLSKLLQSRTEIFSDVGEKLTGFLNSFDNFDLSAFDNQKWKTDCAVAKQMLPQPIELTDKNFDTLHDSLSTFAEAGGYKKDMRERRPYELVGTLDVYWKKGEMKMDRPLLNNPDLFPTSEVIADTLGSAFVVFEDFIDKLNKHFTGIGMEWRYYNDSKAWLCQLLFYG
ncbi:glutamate--trna ligase [Holotrichia oblita]|nr:glutamate--trna ligase [Holotrichia oblita]